MSTTTSVNDSGLLGYLIPKFEEAYGYKVEIFSAGTGKAIANAKCGNADLILVHAKAQEEDFIKAGFARTVEGQNAERLSYMYNYFVLCGPPDDPVGVKGMSVTDAFAAIAEQGAKFVARGGGSGAPAKSCLRGRVSLGSAKIEPALRTMTGISRQTPGWALAFCRHQSRVPISCRIRQPS